MGALANIQGKAQSGSVAEAEALLRGFLADLFDLNIVAVTIRKDTLSLNSVNGFVQLANPDNKTGATTLFFKFHHEESEEGLAEYYNSQMLSDAGFPVEKPLYVSKEVGKQVLLYPVKTSERMADVCKKIESGAFADVVAAQERLDEAICARYISSLHNAPADRLLDEPILQLFYYRLVNDKQPVATELRGRYQSFYAGKTFELPGQKAISFDEMSKLKWCVNGVLYKETLERAFQKSLNILSPKSHLTPAEVYPAVVAHGDAHNGNVWFNKGTPPSLSLFDPAFAGKHVPALLAEIKPTFHNIFAHPLWLYDSKEADAGFDIAFDVKYDVISVTHNWRLSELRMEFLRSKRDRLWKPLLRALQAKGMLPADWQDYMRSALFCCPTLVMNLRANDGTSQNSHTPKTSLLGLSISMMLSSPPLRGRDIVSDFFLNIDHAITSE